MAYENIGKWALLYDPLSCYWLKSFCVIWPVFCCPGFQPWHCFSWMFTGHDISVYWCSWCLFPGLVSKARMHARLNCPVSHSVRFQHCFLPDCVLRLWQTRKPLLRCYNIFDGFWKINWNILPARILLIVFRPLPQTVPGFMVHCERFRHRHVVVTWHAAAE